MRWPASSIAALRRVASVASTPSTSLAVADLEAAPRPFESIPGPASVPLLGGLLNRLRWGHSDHTRYHETLQELHRRYGPLVREGISGGMKTILHVFEPEDIRTVSLNEGRWPETPPLQEGLQLYRSEKHMSLGLGNLNGEKWNKLRKNCQQKMLRKEEVEFHFGSVRDVACDFVDSLWTARDPRSGVVDNLEKRVAKWNMESMGKVVFGRRLGYLAGRGGDREKEAEEIIAANEDMFELTDRMRLGLPLYRFLPTPSWKRLVAAEDVLTARVFGMVEQAFRDFSRVVQSGSESERANFEFLAYLLSKEELSYKDIGIICFSLFTDGLSTTTPTILFNLHCLAANPLSQEKIRREVRRVTGGKGLRAGDAAKMVYTKAFIKETLRLYPNNSETSRVTPVPLVLSGFSVPAGTHVDLNPFVHFRSPAHFPSPDAHRPERWLRGHGDAGDVHPFLFIPFSRGPRMCPGKRFAEQDMTLLLATLASRFRLSLPEGKAESDMGQKHNTLLLPDRKIRIRLQEIQGHQET